MPSPPSTTRAHLLSLLREGHTLTQQQMTERLSITSKRQARRHIRGLQDDDVPIQEEWRAGEKAYSLPPEAWASDVRLTLDEQETMALLLAAEAMRSGLGSVPLKEALDGAFEALAEGLPPMATFEPDMLRTQLHFGEAASVSVDPEVFMTLTRALANRRSIEIEYYSASSDEQSWRRVDPWGVALRGEAWLLVAHDYRHDERRDFNLTRIQEIRPAYSESHGGDYHIPGDFDLERHFAGRFEALSDEQIREVRLLLEPEVVPYFESKQYHRTQQLHVDDPAVASDSDRQVVSYEIAGLKEIAAFVRSWGPKVKVLHPPALAEKVAAEARAVVARYDRSDPDGTPDTKRPEA